MKIKSTLRWGIIDSEGRCTATFLCKSTAKRECWFDSSCCVRRVLVTAAPSPKRRGKKAAK